MSDDDVIDFASERTKRQGLTVKRGNRLPDNRTCHHMRVAVYEDQARCECRDCGAPLDPHQVLLQYADKERQFLYSDIAARGALKKLRQQADELARLEKNTKARIRRAEARLSELEARIAMSMPPVLVGPTRKKTSP